MTGHLFIVHGDLTSIACDAIFVPTDEGFSFTESWDALELERPSQPWSKRRVLLYRNNPGEPAVWLGNIGLAGNDNPFALYEAAITDFVAQAKAHAEHNPADRPWHLPRLALNVVGSGEGGARFTKGGLILGLVKLLRRLARQYHTDIIFVTYGEKPYAAAQLARRQLLVNGARREPTKEEVEKEWRFAEFTPKDLSAQAIALAEVSRNDRLVLFIGAGCGVGAGLPTWKQLLRDAAKTAGIDDKYLTQLESRDLRDWATLINRKMHGEGNIHNVVAAAIGKHHRYSLQHALLASLPSSEAVTTNFDQLFELASRVAERDLSVLPMHPGRSASGWLLKLHGSVDNPSEMVLTRSDYLDMPRNRGALMGLVQGLLLTRHMLYIGYSLSDEDFHELVHEVRTAVGQHGQRATMIALSADQTQRDLWEDDLDIVTMGLDPSQQAEYSSEGGRQVEIFLDLVGFWSTTSAPFFLDSDYAEMSVAETKLKKSLEDLASSMPDSREGPVANQVRKLLLNLGLPGVTRDVQQTERLTMLDHRAGRLRIRRERFVARSGTVEINLRGTALTGHWDSKDDEIHRCGVLTFANTEKSKFRSLVEPGERLEILEVTGQHARLGER